MINSFDTIDYAFLFFIILSGCLILIGLIFAFFATLDDPKNENKSQTLGGYLVNIGILALPVIVLIFMITFSSDRDISEQFTSKSNAIRVEIVRTSPYKTVYRNNDGIDVSVKKTTADNIYLPAVFHRVHVPTTLVDKDLKDFNEFTFSKNEAKRTSERLTETVVAKDSQLTKADPNASTHIEKVEFATRTYRFSLFDSHIEHTEPIARVTVSYQLDNVKVQEHTDGNAIDKLIGKD